MVGMCLCIGVCCFCVPKQTTQPDSEFVYASVSVYTCGKCTRNTHAHEKRNGEDGDNTYQKTNE
jgi:uncharacterized Zn ribbon protein